MLLIILIIKSENHVIISQGTKKNKQKDKKKRTEQKFKAILGKKQNKTKQNANKIKNQSN